LGEWISRDPIGEEGGLNLYGYVANDPITGIDPLGLDTYTINRTMGGGPALPRDFLHTYSHTYTFTTYPDGSIQHTYSWGNTANLHGWNIDQPEDWTAADEALKKGYAQREGDASLDPYVDAAYDLLNKKENEHVNLGVTRNCKQETQNLLGNARRIQDPNAWLKSLGSASDFAPGD